MKQHMLTHKIRDMPQHMFDNNKTASISSDESSQVATSLQHRETSSDGEQHHQPVPQPLPQQPPPQPQQQQQQQQQQPQQTQPQPQQQQPQQQIPQQPTIPPTSMSEQNKDPQPIKREPTETELPLPKRPPSKLFPFIVLQNTFI